MPDNAEVNESSGERIVTIIIPINTVSREIYLFCVRKIINDVPDILTGLPGYLYRIPAQQGYFPIHFRLLRSWKK